MSVLKFIGETLIVSVALALQIFFAFMAYQQLACMVGTLAGKPPRKWCMACYVKRRWGI